MSNIPPENENLPPEAQIEMENTLASQEGQIESLQEKIAGLELELTKNVINPQEISQALNATLGMQLSEINDGIQQLVSESSSRSPSGQSNYKLMGTIFAATIGDRIAMALPLHGQKALTAGISGITGVGNATTKLLSGEEILPALGEGIASAAALYEGFTKLNQSMLQSGAVTGQGASAGYGQLEKAVSMGFESLINPFDMLTIGFADQIIATFRSAGFKDGLAYAMSDAVGSLTKQIGEGMAKSILPTIVDFATTTQNLTDGLANSNTLVAGTVTDFIQAIKNLQTLTPSLTASAPENLAIIQTLTNKILQAGQPGPSTGSTLAKFVNLMESQLGFTPNKSNASGLANAVVSMANMGAFQPFTGINPLQSFSTPQNQAKTLQAFPEFMAQQAQLAKSAGINPEDMGALTKWVNLYTMQILQGYGVSPTDFTTSQATGMIQKLMEGQKGQTPQQTLERKTAQSNFKWSNNIGNIMDKSLEKATEQQFAMQYSSNYVDKNLLKLLTTQVTEPEFNTWMKNQYPGVYSDKLITYQDLQSLAKSHPNANLPEWIQSKLLGSDLKSTIIPALKKQVTPDQYSNISATLSKVISDLQASAENNTLSSANYNKDVITVINTFNGKTSGITKMLLKDIQTVIKQGGQSYTYSNSTGT